MPDAFIRGIPRAEDRVDEYRHVASYASAASATSSAHADFRFDFHCPRLTSFHPKQSLFRCHACAYSKERCLLPDHECLKAFSA
jgi:hypothetical protein